MQTYRQAKEKEEWEAVKMNILEIGIEGNGRNFPS